MTQLLSLAHPLKTDSYSLTRKHALANANYNAGGMPHRENLFLQIQFLKVSALMCGS